MSISQNLETAFKRKEGVIFRVIAGEMFLIPTFENLADMKNVFTTNEVGEYIWNQFDGIKKTSVIASHIAKEFDIDEETASQDLHAFISDLLEKKFIVS